MARFFPVESPTAGCALPGCNMKLIVRIQLPERRPAFSHPMPIATRTVILEPLFRRSSNCLYVDPCEPDAARKMRECWPATVAGRLNAVLGVAGEISPTHAVVIFTREGRPCLTDADRDALWKAYRVPVFEQVITPEGRLVAWECEAHEGMHLADGAHAMADRIIVGECDCGSPATRVFGPVMAPIFTNDDVPMLLLPTQTGSRPQPIPT